MRYQCAVDVTQPAPTYLDCPSGAHRLRPVSWSGTSAECPTGGRHVEFGCQCGKTLTVRPVFDGPEQLVIAGSIVSGPWHWEPCRHA